MPKVTPELFSILNDEKIEKVLLRLYKAALKQTRPLIFHFLPKAHQLLTKKGMKWKNENLSFYDDKYIPIHPNQGDFLYWQARAVNARNIFEFGTSYGISTIYLAKAARDNGGKVFSTEYLPHKVAAAKANIAEAGLSDFVEIYEGDARETLKKIEIKFDFVLLDGFPDLVFEIFKLIEPKLNKGAIIMLDDVEGFTGEMQDYLDYVRNPQNGYISMIIKPKKAMEVTVKVH